MKDETKDDIKRAVNTIFQLFVFLLMAVSAAYFLTLFGLHFIIVTILSLIIATIFHNVVFVKKEK